MGETVGKCVGATKGHPEIDAVMQMFTIGAVVMVSQVST